jgi:hypothetical protein
MSLQWPSAQDIVLGGTVPPPFSDFFNHILPFQFRLTAREQAYHAAIFGASGSGKSKLLQSIFLQHHALGHGVGLIDPHADLALDILKSLIASGFFRREKAFEQLIFLDFANGSFIPFNVLNQNFDPHTTALNALEGMIRVWPELEQAPLFQTLFLAAVTTLIACKLPITPYLYHILTDGQFRNACLQQVTDPLIHLAFRNYYEKLGRDQAQAAGSTLRRAFLLSYSPIIRNSLGQPDNWLDFRTIMNRGKSVIVSLGGLEDETKRLIGAMLMVAIEQAALSRVDITERRPFTLLVDEWGSFAAQERTIATILSQCRKFGLRLYLAAQSLSQVSSNRLSGALENCKLMIAFALGRQSAEIQAKQIGFADPFAVKEAPQTETQHSQYQSITDQFETWNQELMNLPTRCCYVKVPEKAAVRITSLKVPEPTVAHAELAAVLLEYKRRYQRTEPQAKNAQRDVADALFLRGLPGSTTAPAESDSAPVASDATPAGDADGSGIFHNPFSATDKEKDRQ